MELNEEERENWRKFEIVGDLNFYGLLIVALYFTAILLVFLPLIILNIYSLLSVIIVFGMLLSFGYICVDYLRPHIHGNRSFAFTFGVLGVWLAVLIYFIYVKLKEERK